MAQNSPSEFQVIGYLYTEDLAEVERIQYDKVTQVNYSFVMPDAVGGVSAPDETILRALIAKAHAHGVKVGVAVGGWNDGDTSDFEAMAASPEHHNAFIANLVALTERYDADGIDIDWEYPNKNSAGHFTVMMRDLSALLRAKGKSLTAAVIATDDEHGQFIHPEVFGHIDYLNIMAYDWKYAENGGQAHSTYATAEESLDYWVKKGCPKEKAILGVPFYGRMPPVKYKDLIAANPQAAETDIQGTVHYNGLTTMIKKTELARRKGGGIMFWEISQDTHDATSLLGAIDKTVRGFRS